MSVVESYFNTNIYTFAENKHSWQWEDIYFFAEFR
jgi:hypothetical protein